MVAIAIVISNNVSAQAWHSLYTSATGDNFQSLVNVSNPSTFETWMVATDDANKVIVMKMDWAFPTPQPVDIKAFAIPTINPPLGQIYLTSGFFDPAGNIFAYGYEANNNQGFFVRVTINNSGTATALAWSYLNDDDTKIEDACWAPYNNPPYSPYCYGIITRDNFYRVCVLPTNMFTINVAGTNNVKGFTTPTLPTRRVLFSVVYDEQDDAFLISGNNSDINNKGVFYDVILNDGNLTEVGGELFYSSIPIFGRDFKNKLVRRGHEFYIIQSIFVGISNHIMGLWIIRYDYHTNTLISSTVYQFPDDDFAVTVIDADYIDYANLYILGNHIEGFNYGSHFLRKYLVQIDLSNPYNYAAQFLFNRVSNCLNFNNATGMIYVSGANASGFGHLAEVIDLSSAVCDLDIILTTPAFSYNILSFTNYFQNIAPLNIQKAPINVSTAYTINSQLLCVPYSPSAKNFDLSEYNEINFQNTGNEIAFTERYPDKKSITKLKQIEVVEKQFVLKNFEGNCEFRIVDILGRIIQQGTTQNNVVNNINIPQTGVYTITVKDENNGILNSKLIIKE